MKKLLTHRKIWLSVGIASAVLGLLGIVGIPLFALNSKFVLMGICIALVAHCFYGCPFYFIAFANTRVYGRIVDAVEEKKLRELENIAQYAMIKEESIKAFVEKVISRGYLSGYAISEGRLVSSEELYSAENPPPKKCEFCGTVLSENDNMCSACGAPKNM